MTHRGEIPFAAAWVERMGPYEEFICGDHSQADGWGRWGTTGVTGFDSLGEGKLA